MGYDIRVDIANIAYSHSLSIVPTRRILAVETKILYILMVSTNKCCSYNINEKLNYEGFV